MSSRAWSRTSKALNPEIRVNVEGDVGDERILAAMRIGRGPNVVSTSESVNVAAYWADGGLLDLAPWMVRDQVDPAQFLAPTNAYTSSGGKRWSLPMLADAYGLYFDRTRFAAAGISDPPQTIAELTEYAKRLTERNPDGSLRVVGFMPLLGFYENFVANFGHMFGARWTDEAGLSSLGSNPAWSTMLRWQKDLVDWYGYEDLLRFQAEVGPEFSPENAFHTGRMAMMIDGPWRVAMLASGAPDVEYGTAPVPVDGAQPELYGSGYVNGSIIGIPVDADHKAESWKLVKYLATDVDALAKLSNGLRNVPSTGGVARLTRPDAERPIRGVPRYRRPCAEQHDPEHGPRDAVPDGLRNVPRGVAVGRGVRPACRPARGRPPDRRVTGTGHPRPTHPGVTAASREAPLDRLVRGRVPAGLRPAFPAGGCEPDRGIREAQHAGTVGGRPARRGEAAGHPVAIPRRPGACAAVVGTRRSSARMAARHAAAPR